jgi:transposase
LAIKPGKKGTSDLDKWHMFDSFKAGKFVLADRAYDSNALRDWLTELGASGNIRAMPNRLRSPAFSKWLYRQRNVVECFFYKFKHFRAVATCMTSEMTIFSHPSNLLH